ncbi:hypothetical protein PIIN_00091 [Serendipita indica DSM 11827]|uniref:Uncharacterized protein n=1 Tax=Serendipita indica (strain DSM 11827) TaxID=1109443 RepID=G4T540_SERID|nr:hypothetical protein PIIN_00091 [Serendipita indica DSM 11827]
MGPDDAKFHRRTAFGPPSEAFSPSEFAQIAAVSKSEIIQAVHDLWQQNPDIQQQSISEEMNLTEVDPMIANILSRSNLRAVFSKRYEEHAIKHSPGSPLSPLGTDQKTTQLLRTLEKAELRHWPYAASSTKGGT